MAKKLGIYKCELCGNIVEVLHEGGGNLSCCGKEMVFMHEQKADSSMEKHVPYIEKTESGYIVKVGETVEHPMNVDHYIEWIELFVDDKVYRKHLAPLDKPIVEFCVQKGKVVSAREYCNLHGHWSSKF